jgi:hypothetical protein
MRRALLAAIAIMCCAARAAHAQDMFQDTEYISGKSGFDEKVKGTLFVAPQAMRFMTKEGTVLFSIPIEHITEASQDVQIRDASVGKKLLWGGLAGSRKQEFVQVTTESEETAEGVVFKVKQGTSVNVIAKIRYAMKKAKERSERSVPTDSTVAATDSVAQ